MIIDIYNILVPSIIAAIGWGISPIMDKKALFYLNSDYKFIFLVKILMAGIVSMIYLSFLLINKKVDYKNYKNFKYGLIYIFFAFSLSIFIGQLFYFKALSLTNNTSYVVILTFVLAVIILSILSYYFLNETLNNKMIFGIILALTGISITTYYSKQLKNNA